MLKQRSMDSNSVNVIDIRESGDSEESKKCRPRIRRIKLALDNRQNSEFVIEIRKRKKSVLK